MFKVNYDYFNNPTEPDFILCKANGERLGVIPCIDKKITVKYNSYDEIDLSTPLFINGEYNSIYPLVDELKYILVPEVGFFVISSIETTAEGTISETKTINAASYEYLLGQKYLEDFTINKGTTGSIDGVQLFNLADKDKSLLDLVLEKCPDWEIYHVDVGLETKQRSFETSRTDVYSFLTSDVSEAFECIFEFDTLNKRISVYTEENSGEDTDISLSFNNLLVNATVSSNIDDIKTCLKLTGDDDLTIREVNMGYDRIYNLEYFNSTDHMSEDLYEAYNKWKKLYEKNLTPYNEELKKYEDAIETVNYWTHEKMPDDKNSEDWTQYGLVPLQEKKDSYEVVLTSRAEAGWGKETHEHYQDYITLYNKCEAIKSRISWLESNPSSEIVKANKIKETSGAEMSRISETCAIQNNMTPEQYKELSTFIREDELSSSNYVVTDSMTTEEKYEMLDDFLEYGKRELAKVAAPVLSFSLKMANPFAIDTFRSYNGYFTPGNYIYVTLRDDYNVKARMQTIKYNFHDVSDFEIEFGNIMERDGFAMDVGDAIKLATSTATSVSFNSSKWSQSAKDTDDIGKILDDGLISAGKHISSGDDSKMVIDKRGIFVNTLDNNGNQTGESIFIGGGRILFTDNQWKTVSEAIGHINVKLGGKQQTVFGVLAKAVIAGYVASTYMEASDIVSSTITSTSYNNGNGTFQVDENGHLKCTDADITGTVKANTGYIGGTQGFTITGDNNKGYLYTNNKTSYNSSTAGVYLGTDGIGLGSGKFYVDSAGNLVCTSATIGGIKVDANSIHSTNGNFKVTDSGYAEFKNVFVSGVNNGSSFGTVSVSDKGTYGNFGNGFAANTSFDVSGGAWSNFKDLVVDSITAKKVLADYVQTSELNAVSARVGSLESDHVSTSDLSATNAEIKNLKSASINVNRLTAGTVNGHKVGWVRIKFANEVHIELNTDGTVRSHGVTYKYMYVMADVEDS